MAAHINEYFKPHSPVLPGQILTGAALTSIHSLVGQSIGDPGDGILVSRPVYGRFELDFGNVAALNIVYADPLSHDVFRDDNVTYYQNAYDEAAARGVNVKALLIVNPNNPLGMWR
jgi:1-aminocyclopropane-1-carboxylate synthase